MDTTTVIGDNDDLNAHALVSDALVSDAEMASRAVDITRSVGDFDVTDPRFWMETFSAQVMQIQLFLLCIKPT